MGTLQVMVGLAGSFDATQRGHPLQDAVQRGVT